MKVIYKNLTPAEVFELIARDDGRDDLFFEYVSQNAPQVLCNLKHHKLDFLNSHKVIWFKRELEEME